MTNWKISNAGIAVLLMAALVSMAHQVEAASEKRSETGPKAASKDWPDTSTQWKAHPEKGWVRAGVESEFRKGKKQRSNGDDTRRNNSSKVRKE
jgi:hypothetical protein